jgi:hypothetical protein
LKFPAGNCTVNFRVAPGGIEKVKGSAVSAHMPQAFRYDAINFLNASSSVSPSIAMAGSMNSRKR